MKKVGIITIVDYDNYGNRLQNYAVQEVLRKIGLESETIVNKPINLKNISLKLKRIFNKSSKEIIIILIRKTSKVMKTLRQLLIKTKFEKKQITENQKIDELKYKRETNFKEFTKMNIKETLYTITPDTIPNDFYKNYDYFIVGSDQVWNPNFRLGSSIDFLTFAKPEQRVAYAASFGITELSREIMSNYKSWLAEMAHISVREESGAGIIKEMIGRDVDVLVDPTLMISKEQWLSISKDANNKPSREYLLTYFLGGVPHHYMKQIKKIAIENNLEILNMGDIKEEETYVADPSQFIDYIKSCKVFCTDSFHGAVFSILLEKPFIVYERVGALSMFSRIDTLLKKFKLESRKAENIKSNEDVFSIDYTNTPNILEKERNKSFNYLKKALNIEDGI